MPRYVTDTHALIWHLQSSSRLSRNARTIFQQADAGQVTIIIPSIVLVELVYLAEKEHIAPKLVNQVFALLAPPTQNYVIAHLETQTVQVLRSIARSQVPEMPDRIIAATAKQLNLPLITRDATLRAVSGLTVVW
jgi:predicted nucleic acid-binding protein